MKLFLGIDPGLHGALACFSTIRGRRSPDIFDTPYLLKNKKKHSDVRGMAEILQKYNPELFVDVRVYAAIEEVHTMPKQGVSSSGKFMHNFGIWLGLLECLWGGNFDYRTVTPQQWKKYYGLNGKPKDMALDVAKELWPGIDLLRPTPGGTKLNPCVDRADAALIANYIREQHKTM